MLAISVNSAAALWWCSVIPSAYLSLLSHDSTLVLGVSLVSSLPVTLWITPHGFHFLQSPELFRPNTDHSVVSVFVSVSFITAQYPGSQPPSPHMNPKAIELGEELHSPRHRCTSTPALEEYRQSDQKFKASLGSMRLHGKKTTTNDNNK